MIAIREAIIIGEREGTQNSALLKQKMGEFLKTRVS